MGGVGSGRHGGGGSGGSGKHIPSSGGVMGMLGNIKHATASQKFAMHNPKAATSFAKANNECEVQQFWTKERT